MFIKKILIFLLCSFQVKIWNASKCLSSNNVMSSATFNTKYRPLGINECKIEENIFCSFGKAISLYDINKHKAVLGKKKSFFILFLILSIK